MHLVFFTFLIWYAILPKNRSEKVLSVEMLLDEITGNCNLDTEIYVY